ncbi:MAG: glycosyltransferase family 61 protein, partial [Pseudomonadota bacterium]
TIACTVEDAVFRNRLIYKDGIPVMGVSNIRWEMNAAESAQEGALEVPEPDEHLPGRTGLVIGRSPFNYYHFISDCLTFLEGLRPLMDDLGFDRIMMNPAIVRDQGFQWHLVREIYPDLVDRLHFTDTAFRADHLTFLSPFPSLFAPGADGTPFTKQGPKGVSRRSFLDTDKPLFDRAEAMIGSRDFADRRDIIVISRREADRRVIINEDALVDALRPFNVRPVVMEKLSVAEQMDLMAGARVVIGPHGAGMINTGFCQAGTTAIELTGRHYMQRSFDFAKIGIIRHMNYQFLIADEHGEIEHMTGNMGNDIRLSDRAIAHLVATVDAALSASGPREALSATHGLVEEASRAS